MWIKINFKHFGSQILHRSIKLCIDSGLVSICVWYHRYFQLTEYGPLNGNIFDSILKRKNLHKTIYPNIYCERARKQKVEILWNAMIACIIHVLQAKRLEKWFLSKLKVYILYHFQMHFCQNFSSAWSIFSHSLRFRFFVALTKIFKKILRCMFGIQYVAYKNIHIHWLRQLLSSSCVWDSSTKKIFFINKDSFGISIPFASAFSAARDVKRTVN